VTAEEEEMDRGTDEEGVAEEGMSEIPEDAVKEIIEVIENTEGVNIETMQDAVKDNTEDAEKKNVEDAAKDNTEDAVKEIWKVAEDVVVEEEENSEEDGMMNTMVGGILVLVENMMKKAMRIPVLTNESEEKSTITRKTTMVDIPKATMKVSNKLLTVGTSRRLGKVRRFAAEDAVEGVGLVVVLPVAEPLEMNPIRKAATLILRLLPSILLPWSLTRLVEALLVEVVTEDEDAAFMPPLMIR
jgi:hypothetical protein